MNRLSIYFFLLFVSCSSDSPSDLMLKEDLLTLKWNKAYSDDTIDKSAIGLQWAFSYIGARIVNPSGIQVASKSITIKLDELGFDENAVGKLKIIHQKIRASDEYKKVGAIDLGRYVTLLIGAPEHYYEITDLPNTLEEVLSPYVLLSEKGYVNNSGVSLEHRIIQFSEQDNLKQVFLSSEVDSVSGEVYEYETIEIIPNGQVRFGIFDADGNRKNNASPTHSNAGKPAKCMWCHESTISRMFNPQEDFQGYLSYEQLQNKLINYNQLLTDQKALLLGGVDFSQTQQHTFTELLYISFMEPSAERLSEEWQIPLDKVQQMLSGLPTHVYDEFPFLGNLYHRKDIENLAPFEGLKVSSSVREKSEIEVNHLN